jgi:predicted alpha/beta superfamily hydrolase
MKHRLFTAITIAMVSWPSLCPAQPSPTIHDSLYSAALQEERHIDIVLPKDYDPAKPEKYEVLYCLEGVSDFVTTEYNFLSGEGFIPDLILVGVLNTQKNGVTNRDRDLTPTHTDGETGGADKYLSYLKDELLPYMQKHYPVKSSGHSLYGGSLSGLLAVYAFLKEPTLFTSYIAVDPSLWWDNFWPVQYAAKRFAGFGVLHNTLWLAGREGSAFRYMGVEKMDSLLSLHAPTGLVWQRRLYDNETHYSTQFKGLWDGLKFSYGGFYASKGGYNTSRGIAIKPARGLVAKDKPFHLICYNLADSPYIRYSVDGSEPTATSPSLTGEQTLVTITRTGWVRFKSFGVRDEYARTDSAYYEVGEVIKPISKPAGVQPGGLGYSIYEGNWDSLPDRSRLPASRKGRGGFDFSTFPSTGYLVAFDGYIYIDKPGYYIFENGGKQFRATLGGRRVLGDHIGPGGESFMVPLAKGFYPLEVEYLHVANGDGSEPLYLKPESIDDFPVPANILYSQI